MKQTTSLLSLSELGAYHEGGVVHPILVKAVWYYKIILLFPNFKEKKIFLTDNINLFFVSNVKDILHHNFALIVNNAYQTSLLLYQVILPVYHKHQILSYFIIINIILFNRNITGSEDLG